MAWTRCDGLNVAQTLARCKRCRQWQWDSIYVALYFHFFIAYYFLLSSIVPDLTDDPRREYQKVNNQSWLSVSRTTRSGIKNKFVFVRRMLEMRTRRCATCPFRRMAIDFWKHAMERRVLFDGASCSLWSLRCSTLLGACAAKAFARRLGPRARVIITII